VGEAQTEQGMSEDRTLTQVEAGRSRPASGRTPLFFVRDPDGHVINVLSHP